MTTPVNAAGTGTATSPSLTQTHVGIPASATGAGTGSNATLTETHSLSPASAAGAASADNGVILQSSTRALSLPAARSALNDLEKDIVGDATWARIDDLTGSGLDSDVDTNATDLAGVRTYLKAFGKALALLHQRGDLP